MSREIPNITPEDVVACVAILESRKIVRVSGRGITDWVDESLTDENIEVDIKIGD